MKDLAAQNGVTDEDKLIIGTRLPAKDGKPAQVPKNYNSKTVGQVAKQVRTFIVCVHMDN